MGRILNTPAKRRVLTSPSTLDPARLRDRRYRIKADVSNVIDDLIAILESGDGALKSHVSGQLRRIEPGGDSPDPLDMDRYLDP